MVHILVVIFNLLYSIVQAYRIRIVFIFAVIFNPSYVMYFTVTTCELFIPFVIVDASQ